MNAFILKFCILIGAMLTTTAFVGADIHTSSSSAAGTTGGLDAQSIFAFGSQVFYKEVAQPGNEYVQAGVSGYSHDLVTTNAEDQTYATAWQAGVSTFLSGYTKSTGALVDLATVPSLKTNAEKMAVCDEFSTGEEEINQSESYFLAAKASASPATASGFTIAMVLERVDEILASSDAADQSCMKAVLADHNHNPGEFSRNLKDTENAVQEMRRIYPELQVLSSDFT
ncbi:hypothetical protein [Methanoregula sp.]|uniref:hypothetical protein n=1 Tax=Methanoregula sp. TaxID=2052170 RepID=UPI003BAEC83D